MHSDKPKPRQNDDFTYADELALTRHLVDTLEDRLAGRHQSRVLRIVPSDHCHLGVLGPRDPIVDGPEIANDAETDQLNGQQDENPNPPSPVVGNSESKSLKETDNVIPEFTDAEQRVSERSGESRDSTRRPPSALGFELTVSSASSADAIELQLKSRFAVYVKRFPTFEEQYAEIGSPDQVAVTTSDTDQSQPDSTPARQAVTLLEAFERIVVEPPPVVFRASPSNGDVRLTDNGVVQKALDEVLSRALRSLTAWRPLKKAAMVPVSALGSPAAFNEYIDSISDAEVECPPLKASLDIRVSWVGDRARVRCYLRNDTLRNAQQRYLDQHNILADCSLHADIVSGTLLPIELLPVAEDYQFNRQIWAVGHSASAIVSNSNKSITTQSLARFEQSRRTTVQQPHATFEALIRDPLGTLESIRLAMVEYGDNWQKQVIDANERGLQSTELTACSDDLESFRTEEHRFASGIAALVADPRLMQSFIAMNRVFQRTSRGRYDAWHLFQIVFIVCQLPALVIREGKSAGNWPDDTPRNWSDALEWVDVLWFPTGGGKTEAYLGLISCSTLYDRLRGKRFGISAWLRFPLRMLSVQQLQRAAAVVWETEQERLSLLGDRANDSDPIALGYFVGKTSTPNTLRASNDDEWSLTRLEADEELRNRLLLVTQCPACGTDGTIAIKIDIAAMRIRHICQSCRADLPIYVSDDEIYRFLPSVIIGTVDKMATVAYQPKFAMLWGGASWKCPISTDHGYGMGDWCVYGCPSNPKSGRNRPTARKAISAYDPSPSLHIQDELHLLQEELGAFAGHYETLVRSCETAFSLPPKIIAATATIEGFEHQSRHVYGVPNARRFPGRGYDRDSSFYMNIDPDPEDPSRAKVMRLYVAFKPPHLHSADAASLCTRLLHEELIRLYASAEDVALWLPTCRSAAQVRSLLNFYVTTLTYVGSKARGVRVRHALERDSGRLRPGSSRDLTTEFLSGESSLAQIASVVRRVEKPARWDNELHLDAAIATSIISHGVDVERFNVMVMDGIPEETADYIQASSRSGRRHVGIVISVLASYSLRASSIYHRFKEFHAHLDRMVSPVPVNRFAKFAVHRTASGIFVGIIFGRYGALSHSTEFKKRNASVELLSGRAAVKVSDEQFRKAVYTAYALGSDIYDSSLELAMREAVDDRLQRFLFTVRGSQQELLTKTVKPAPMTSLRDVDTPVNFAPSEMDYNKLAWFSRDSQ